VYCGEHLPHENERESLPGSRRKEWWQSGTREKILSSNKPHQPSRIPHMLESKQSTTSCAIESFCPTYLTESAHVRPDSWIIINES
jgi:hypothetical protein